MHRRHLRLNVVVLEVLGHLVELAALTEAEDGRRFAEVHESCNHNHLTRCLTTLKQRVFTCTTARTITSSKVIFHGLLSAASNFCNFSRQGFFKALGSKKKSLVPQTNRNGVINCVVHLIFLDKNIQGAIFIASI